MRNLDTFRVCRVGEIPPESFDQTTAATEFQPAADAVRLKSFRGTGRSVSPVVLGVLREGRKERIMSISYVPVAGSEAITSGSPSLVGLVVDLGSTITHKLAPWTRPDTGTWGTHRERRAWPRMKAVAPSDT